MNNKRLMIQMDESANVGLDRVDVNLEVVLLLQRTLERFTLKEIVPRPGPRFLIRSHTVFRGTCYSMLICRLLICRLINRFFVFPSSRCPSRSCGRPPWSKTLLRPNASMLLLVW